MATAFDRRLSAGSSWKLVIKRGDLYLYWTTDSPGDFVLDRIAKCHRKTALGGHKQSERGLKYFAKIAPAGWLPQPKTNTILVRTIPINFGLSLQVLSIELKLDTCLMTKVELDNVLREEISTRDSSHQSSSQF